MIVDNYLFAEHDWVPNNAKLPVILYVHALPLDHATIQP